MAAATAGQPARGAHLTPEKPEKGGRIRRLNFGIVGDMEIATDLLLRRYCVQRKTVTAPLVTRRPSRRELGITGGNRIEIMTFVGERSSGSVKVRAGRQTPEHAKHIGRDRQKYWLVGWTRH